VTRKLRFQFPLRGGLHARPASAIRDAASNFRADVTLSNHRTERRANAKSVLALVATLTRQGDECTVCVAGDDEASAFAEMERFVSSELPLCDQESPPTEPVRGAGGPLPRVLRADGVRLIHGLAAGGGIGRGPASLVMGKTGWPDLADRTAVSPEEEVAHLERAIAQVGARLRLGLSGAGNDTERAITGAHLSILEDVELRAGAVELIRSRAVAAGQAVISTAERFARVLDEAGSALLAERVLDLHDVASLILQALYPELAADECTVLEPDGVLVAEALSPAQFLDLDRSRLRGIVLARGGVTSHTAILARAGGAPCVTGLGAAIRSLREGVDVIVDGERGLVVLDPAPAVARFYTAQMAVLLEERRRLADVAARPASTADGRRIEVAANVGSLPEVQLALTAGADAIGLFRTELLFMGRAQAPSEEEQTAVYGKAARLAGRRPVIIRTLDVGGDKPIPYLPLPAESNPFLGFRAIRIYETHRQIAGAQIRAILRASAEGNVKLLFPMVSSLEEVRSLRGLVSEQMNDLLGAGVPFNREIEIGIMIEVPALAFIMDHLVREVDFFSIGSNDLLQYFLAVERNNEVVAHLYDAYQPSFLRVLRTICETARAHGRWIGLCGELAADALVVPLLIGLGLDELSVGSAQQGTVKAVVESSTAAECRELAAAVMAAETSADVGARLRAFARRGADHSVLGADLVRLGSEARTREEALRELVDLLRLAGRLTDPDLVEEAVWRREDTCSTAVGFGVAVPHCKSEGVLATSIAVATYGEGLSWHSADDEPVRLAILIAVSAEASGDAHLVMIAKLSRKLMDDEFRAALLAAGSAADVVALLQGVVGVE